MAATRMPNGDYEKKLVRLPPEIIEWLQEEGAHEHRSMNGQLVHVLARLHAEAQKGHKRREPVSA